MDGAAPSAAGAPKDLLIMVVLTSNRVYHLYKDRHSCFVGLPASLDSLLHLGALLDDTEALAECMRPLHLL